MTPLTAREDQIRALVVDGLTNEEIASALRISSRTVEAHLRMLFRKLGVHRRDALAAPARTPEAVETPTDASVLEERLARQERELDAYRGVVQRLVDRQFPLFEERVEMTVVVGRQASEDLVVERHFTKPNPYVVYRMVRPITPWRLTTADVRESKSLICEVVGADVGVAVDLVPDENDRPRALIFFQPGLQTPTEWILRYRTPGLWDPLRTLGEDQLRWAPGQLDARSPASVHELTMHFDFPPGTEGAAVFERYNIGSTTEESTDTGLRITYRDQSRAGAHYTFNVKMNGGM